MGLRVKIKGDEELEFDEHSILKAQYMTDTPDDSNARSSNVMSTIRIHGKILTAVNGQPHDHVLKLAKWSLVRAEVADSYREFKLETVLAGQVVRSITFPEAFIVDYTEDYSDSEGTGTFDLTVRQKKDLFDNTVIAGGYEA